MSNKRKVKQKRWSGQKGNGGWKETTEAERDGERKRERENRVTRKKHAKAI